MFQISYAAMVILISAVWVLIRAMVCIKHSRVNWRREAQLLLVYVCMVVVARFTFFPFDKLEGKVQPLIFDAARLLPLRINIIPFANLLDYPDSRSILLNIIGNTAMFLPLGIIWPIVYKELNTHKKIIAAGVCFSLCIEILQLPFYDRVSDIDDLILNFVGFLIGYGPYVMVKKIKKASA